MCLSFFVFSPEGVIIIEKEVDSSIRMDIKQKESMIRSLAYFVCFVNSVPSLNSTATKSFSIADVYNMYALKIALILEKEHTDTFLSTLSIVRSYMKDSLEGGTFSDSVGANDQLQDIMNNDDEIQEMKFSFESKIGEILKDPENLGRHIVEILNLLREENVLVHRIGFLKALVEDEPPLILDICRKTVIPTRSHILQDPPSCQILLSQDVIFLKLLEEVKTDMLFAQVQKIELPKAIVSADASMENIEITSFIISTVITEAFARLFRELEGHLNYG